jgi:hypothetical protein
MILRVLPQAAAARQSLRIDEKRHQVKETAMLNKLLTLTAVAVLAALLLPSKVDAWGAARVGGFRVGPYGGVYGGSRTVVAGPRGVAVGGRSFGGYGGYGGVYRGGYGGGVGYGGYGGYGGAYRYNYGYGGYGGYGAYGWVR